MNVSELLRERDRLHGVLQEAKSARSKLKQVNVLIAMYGTPEDVAATNGHAEPGPGDLCPECGAGPFKGYNGLAMHRLRLHGVRKQKAAG